MQFTLRAHRINAGLKQEDMAQSLCVSRQTISSWESGKSMPTVDKIESICKMLGISYDDIRWNV